MADMNTMESPPEQRLKELERRIGEARARREKDRHRKGADAHAAAHHLVLRLLADMGVALAAGGLLGWGADSYFGSRPWGTLAGVLLGLAAGVRNVLHTADAVSRRAAAGKSGDTPASGMSSINGKNAQNGGE